MSKRNNKNHILKTQPHSRRRDGQPGNNNPLKHGFYSQSSPSGKCLSSDSVNPSEDVLAKEIAALPKIFNDLVVHYHNAQDMHMRLTIADRIALFSARISQLARSQHFLSPPKDPFLTELDAACEAVTADWPLMDIFRPYQPKPPLSPESGETSPSPPIPEPPPPD